METCRECSSPFIIDDMSSGDTVCTCCGLVQQAHRIEEYLEWAGAPRVSFTKQTDQPFLPAEAALQQTARGRMQLPESIVRHACELYRRLHAAAVAKVAAYPAMPAACVFFACKQAGVPRRKVEMCEAFGVGVTAFTRACSAFKTLMGPELREMLTATQSRDLLARYSSSLRSLLDNATFSRVMCTARELEEETSASGALRGKTPISVTATILYAACERCCPGAVPKAAVLAATGVSSTTLNRALKLL